MSTFQLQLATPLHFMSETDWSGHKITEYTAKVKAGDLLNSLIEPDAWKTNRKLAKALKRLLVANVREQSIKRNKVLQDQIATLSDANQRILYGIFNNGTNFICSNITIVNALTNVVNVTFGSKEGCANGGGTLTALAHFLLSLPVPQAASILNDVFVTVVFFVGLPAHLVPTLAAKRNAGTPVKPFVLSVANGLFDNIRSKCKWTIEWKPEARFNNANSKFKTGIDVIRLLRLMDVKTSDQQTPPSEAVHSVTNLLKKYEPTATNPNTHRRYDYLLERLDDFGKIEDKIRMRIDEICLDKLAAGEVLPTAIRKRNSRSTSGKMYKFHVPYIYWAVLLAPLRFALEYDANSAKWISVGNKRSVDAIWTAIDGDQLVCDHVEKMHKLCKVRKGNVSSVGSLSKHADFWISVQKDVMLSNKGALTKMM